MRDFKIEIKDGYTFEYYLHDNNKFEQTALVSGTPPMIHIEQILEQMREMIALMRSQNITSIEVTKI